MSVHEKATQRESVKGKISQKMHQTAQYRFGRLKDFINFAKKHYDAPEVLVLQNSNFKHLQICNAPLSESFVIWQAAGTIGKIKPGTNGIRMGGSLNCLKLMYLLSL